MKTSLLVVLILLLFSGISFVRSQIPRTLSYQGVLTDSAGTPRPDGSYTFTFSLYNSLSGGVRLWNETKPLNLKRGLFSTTLGDVTPFPDSLKFDRAYWLEVSVSGFGTLSPRSPLTSVGYSMNALRADTAKVSIASGSWTKVDTNIYFASGNVGIGGPPPDTVKLSIVAATGQEGLQIEGRAGKFAATIGGNGTTNQSKGLQVTGGTTASDIALQITDALETKEFLRVTGAGGVGIGTSHPTELLHVQDGNFMLQNATPKIFLADNVGTGYIGTDNSKNLVFAPGNVERVRIALGGNVGIGTTDPTEKLEVVGRTKTQVLEITGSDFAEPFELSETDSLPLGSLVVIDPDHPGKLRQSTQAYDKRVAGVISGAGGIYPGIMVSRDGKAGNSQYIAMSGKVYARATASNGAIEPGDLLTTSDIAGHAMKATDETKSHGTVIGKAMSSLQSGTGLVLVLVNLQ